MAAKHGITSTTYQRFIIDQGAVYMNYGESGEALLGATRNGNQFTIEQDIRVMPVDGAKGSVVGSRRIVEVRPIIVANFVEIDKEVLALAFPGADTADYPVAPATKTHDSITRSLTIETTDHLTNIALIGECTASTTNYAEMLIKNALAEGNVEMSFAPNDETMLSITFVGHFQPTDLATEPWEIRYPTVS